MTLTPEFEDVYQVVRLEEVIQFWVKEYVPKEGQIIGTEWWVDPSKGRVIIRVAVKHG